VSYPAEPALSEIEREIMSATHPAGRLVTGFAPARHRNFTLLWGGQTISVVGNGMFMVALQALTDSVPAASKTTVMAPEP
jgi:hypothetical protein